MSSSIRGQRCDAKCASCTRKIEFTKLWETASYTRLLELIELQYIPISSHTELIMQVGCITNPSHRIMDTRHVELLDEKHVEIASTSDKAILAVSNRGNHNLSGMQEWLICHELHVRAIGVESSFQSRLTHMRSYICYKG